MLVFVGQKGIAESDVFLRIVLRSWGVLVLVALLENLILRNEEKTWLQRWKICLRHMEKRHSCEDGKPCFCEMKKGHSCEDGIPAFSR